MRKISLLVVEDEAAIRDMIRFSLPDAEFDMQDAESVAQAIKRLADHIPDLIILDWMLPDKNGVDFIQWLKQQELYKEIPIIFLTARVEEENKIKGLEVGADDYMTKPFSPGELKARIKTILRRGRLVNPKGIIQVDRLQLNVDTHSVTVDEVKLKLTPIEYNLLHFFITHPERAYTRDQLITQVWGGNVYIDERTVDVQIRRLRDRLKPHGYDQFIKTVRGMGYQFQEKINE